MDQELQKAFTRRLSQCNKGELIIIMYDIYFAYDKEARDCALTQNAQGCKNALRKAADTLTELMQGLDFQYEIASNLASLYHYCRQKVYECISLGKLDALDEAKRVMDRLYTSFCQAAKSDTSEPLMSNAQTVYAGFTYGRESINENYDQTSNRGFLV